MKWEKEKNWLTAIKRHRLNIEFSYVFAHFIQCMTVKVGSHDQASFTTTQMVYSTIKNMLFNYARAIFDDMATRLKENDRKHCVAYSRFLAAILKAGMPSSPTEGNYYIPTISLESLEAGIKDSEIRLRDVIASEDTQSTVSPGMSSNLPLNSLLLCFQQLCQRLTPN